MVLEKKKHTKQKTSAIKHSFKSHKPKCHPVQTLPGKASGVYHGFAGIFQSKASSTLLFNYLFILWMHEVFCGMYYDMTLSAR